MLRWFDRTLLIARSLMRPLRDRTGAVTIGSSQREKLYAAAVQSSNLAFLTTGRDGIITGWNPGAELLFGYTANEAIGRNVEILIPAELAKEHAGFHDKLKAGQKIDNIATVRLAKGGKPVHVFIDLSRLKATDAGFIGTFAIMRDATEQQLAEELFGLAVEACPSGMMMTDRDGRIVMVNSQIENLFGYRRAELLGQPIEILVPRDLRSKHRKQRGRMTELGVTGSMREARELYGLHKDGREIPVEIALNSVRVRDGLLILAVLVDVTERKRNERIKDEFVSTVSHELRTPLTSITASLALISAGRAGPMSEAAARLVLIAHSNGQRLVRLINDILDIEKYGSGKMVFIFTQVNTRAIVEQAIETSQAYADECGVNVRFDPQSSSGVVRADSDRLAQIISNLLSNAIKFSLRGGEVLVAIAERDDTVRVTVRDHGLGIPDAFKPHVFDKFAQAEAGDARKKGGTGLGLSIVKQIVDRFGGEVGFESAAGKGTTFHVDLPSWRADVDDQVDDAERRNLVMLCESDPEIAAALSAKLAEAGFKADIAATVNDALQRANSVTYAAVLVDLNLPNGDGIGLIQQLRSRPRYLDKPIVVISGEPESRAAGSRQPALDVLDWLDKPVDLRRLLRVIDRMILQYGIEHPRILHVDDDPAARTAVAEAMRQSAQVVSVASLEEASRTIGKKPFDVAVLDVALIADSGPKFIKELRNADGHLIPVILLSASGANLAYADRVRTALASANDSVDNLITVLARRLGGQAQKPKTVPDNHTAESLSENHPKEVA